MVAAAEALIAEQEANLSFSYSFSISYKVYLHNEDLFYVQDPCGPEGMVTRFYRHIIPVNPADLQSDVGFNNLGDFRFDEYGFRRGNRCFAVVPLPAYAILEIHTGLSGQPRGSGFRPE